MPFKLRLKKSRRHYDVVSKNVFVVSVELLDKAVVECSLSSESNGQECLENVCQRIGLHQAEFFGLRFASKWRRRSTRWLELEKPLKRQLDKYAANAGHSESSVAQLSLGVMYYVGEVALLFDEVTRYHYFLQLKSDIVDGRVTCNADQAVILAAFCLQAEFGNHDPAHHTFEYLSDFPLLPKNLCLDAPNLLSQVIATHVKMVGLAPAAAEQNYIQSAQQLHDYGIEYFQAKDGRGEETLLGVSVVGVVVAKHQSADKSVTFKWSCIANLSNHKRYVVVEHETPNSATNSCSAQFQMEDSDTAKYVWRLCVLQHKFYMRTRSVVTSSNESSAVSDTANWRSISMPNLQSHVGYDTVNSSCGNPYTLHPRHLHGDPRAEYLAMSSGAISELQYEDEEENDEEEDLVSSGYRMSVPYVDVHQGSCELNALDLPSPALDTFDGLHDARLHHQQLSAEELSLRAQRLPTYRPAPDYDTAVRKYGTAPGAPTTSHLSLLPSSNGGVVVVDNVPLASKSYSHYKNFVDLSRAADTEPRSDESRRGQLTTVAAVVGASSYEHLVHLISHRTAAQAQAAVLDPFVDVHRFDTANMLGSPRSDNFSGLHDHHLLDVRRLQQRPSASTPDLAMDRLSLRQNSNSSCNNNVILVDPVSRSSLAGAVLSGSDVVTNISSDASAVNQAVRAKRDVSPGFQFVRPTSAVSSLDSKRSRPPKDMRSRSSSTQSAPDQALVGGSISKERTARMVSTVVQSNGYNQLCKTSDDSRCHVFERKLSEGSLFAEFAAIPRRRPLQGQIDFDCSTALLPENVSRNRFPILPYDDNRVRLTPTVDNPHGYINASHISVIVGDLKRRCYVAAQGPLLKAAADDFWRMVWESNARVIVMLTDVRDGRGADKCFQYWPDDESNVTLQFGDLQVARRFGTRSTSFVTSSLVLSRASTMLPKCSAPPRNVWHIQYVAWPDHGCADVPGFLGLLDEIESVRRHDGAGSTSAPTIVHCSAGVGRSGVTILLDVMIHALTLNEDLDVPKVLAHLRHQRMLLVQTLAQYKFVYAVLVHYLKQSRLI